MFDFKKIGIEPTDINGFTTPATENQITELEQYCKHVLPENYKYILKHYNGGSPKNKFFHVTPQGSATPGEWEIDKFYDLHSDKNKTESIWWIIENYKELIGVNSLPFGENDEQQIYYMKWVNNVPQVWLLNSQDLDEPESYFIMGSFDELLGSLYA